MLCPGYFNSLSNALEMRNRTRSVNDKITYAAEVGASHVVAHGTSFQPSF